MKMIKRIACIFLILTYLLQPYFVNTAFSAADQPILPPDRLRVEPKEADQPAVGYNEYDGHYIDLKWEKVTSPSGANIQIYYNIYVQEISKYGAPSSFVLKERDIPQNTTAWRMKRLKSGTVYHFHVTAYYRETVGNTIISSAESVPSNVIRGMTNIVINAVSYGTSQVKIEWDDVFNTGGKRIDYKLYIAENESFSNTPPIYIGQSQIEPLGSITVNKATGKLEYIYTVKDPGRVYYIKIAPDIIDDGLKRQNQSATVIVSSYILARATKMSQIESGTVWRIDWSPVVTGLGDSNIEIAYQIYRGDSSGGGVEQYVATVENTSFFITLAPGEEDSYYIIRATVTRNGQDIYPVRIQSDRVVFKEQEIPAIPPAPELTDEFRNTSGDVIISTGAGTVNGQLKPTSAAVLWQLPRKGNGNLDPDTVYDIWLITDPNLIDNPPTSTKIATAFKPTSANQVLDGTKVIGYKYLIPNLTPNSTYYVKMVAKKDYLEYVGGVLKSVTYESQPALEVIITPTEGAIDQPEVPGRPPLKIKRDASNLELITDKSAVIQLKNKWYEKFNAATGRWEYIRTEKRFAGDTVDYNPVLTPPDGKVYRLVEYDQGVSIDVGCVKYTDGMDYNDIATIPADKVVNVQVTPNDSTEDASLNPDNQKHNIDITISGLEPNTTYVLWVRAARRNVNLLSGPSDPIIITTDPLIPAPVEKPVVPVFNYHMSGDTYIDLGWDFKAGYTYYIKYGKEDKLTSATGSITVTPQDLQYSTYYRVKDLDMDTLYYFWIQAEAVNSANEKSISEWSDSYPVKTLPVIPPSTPKGFGVKKAKDAVTKNSITFEWIAEEGIEYKLEISEDKDYKNAKVFDAGAVAEFKVEELKSNRRYYARLYAVDPDKKMQSEPTQSIIVKTEKSNDDYDSDQDTDTVISGEFIVKDPVVKNYVWKVSITGINAQRFIQHVLGDNVLDYTLDLNNPPSAANTTIITISNKVFSTLTSLNENLIIMIGGNEFIIRPETFAPKGDDRLARSLGDFNYELRVSTRDFAGEQKVKNMTFNAPITVVSVLAVAGGNSIPVSTFNRPLKITYHNLQNGSFKQGRTSSFIYDTNLQVWKRLETQQTYDPEGAKMSLNFEMFVPGDFTIAELGNDYFDDIYGHWAETSIINVASVHPLKSVSTRNFSPEGKATIGDTVKLMLDVMDYNYGNDFMSVAAKAGIITSSEIDGAAQECTREKAITMAVRLYELKSKQAVIAPTTETGVFNDLDQVTPALLPRVEFAVENGLVVGRDSDTLAPKDTITKGEVIAILERLMAFAGEIE